MRVHGTQWHDWVGGEARVRKGHGKTGERGWLPAHLRSKWGGGDWTKMLEAGWGQDSEARGELPEICGGPKGWWCNVEASRGARRLQDGRGERRGEAGTCRQCAGWDLGKPAQCKGLSGQYLPPRKF